MVSKEDREILFDSEYKLASDLLGDVDENWKYLSFDTPIKDDVLQILDGQSYNIPVVNRAYVFRWMMPHAPNLYSENDRIDAIGIKTGFFRFTIGEKFQIPEEDIENIASGLVEVDNSYLLKIQEYADKAFVFNSLKIPHLRVHVDELDEKIVPSLYENKSAEWKKGINQTLEKLRDEQSEKLARYFSEVKQSIKEQPDYLLILREVVQEKISIEDAIETTNKYPGIFKKGL